MEYFKNKVIWITGASSGIGEELARKLDSYGARLILSARNQEKLETLKDSLSSNQEHLVIPLDLGNSAGFDSMVNDVVEKTGAIHMLINNGGVSQRSAVADTSIDVDRHLMEVNYFGNITLTKLLLPVFRKQGFGHILVVSSIAGKFGFFLRSAYSASKHALHGFYESLLLEEEGNGLRVTIACPGKINTNISLNAIGPDGKKHGVMDHNQATGMSAEECAQQMLSAMSKNKIEVLIGNKEIKAVTLKRFFPNLFWKVIRKQSAT